jgi:hydrophobic/amphiphilic exporter-1 (mainly G- bacteria), HAE1 family
MSPVRFTVDRPIFTTMATLIVVLIGAVAFLRLPIDLMPDITYPTLTVTAQYENAGPEEVEELVTRPLEEALAAVPGVEQITSASTEGASSVRVTFVWGTDLDAAASDVRDRLDRTLARLPDGIERPTLRKFDLAAFPVLILGVASEMEPIGLRRLVDEQVKYRIERVPGVAAVEVQGGLQREIHVDLLPENLHALQIPLDQIVQRIRAQNVNLPAGSIERGLHNVTVRTPGELASLDELRDMVVAVRDGVSVRLGDIARIEDSVRKVTQLVRVNGQPGLRMTLNKQSGTNTVEVARRALAEIERINEDMAQLRITPIINSADYIERSISNVSRAALYGGVLAVVVLLLFLRSMRSSLVVATAIPVSVVATFALMYFGGFTLNIMTLGGLALGVGMLVDNAIVVLENIFRLREKGERPADAATAGTSEVAAAIVASTLTTLVVFLPLIFVRGMSGVMFQQLAYVVGFSLLCSVAVALTLVPMLSARLLGTVGEPKSGLARRLYLAAGRPLDALEAAYSRLLDAALRHRAVVAGGAFLLLGASLMLIPRIGAELMPPSDEGEVRIDAEMEIGTRLERFETSFRHIEELVRSNVPELRSSVSYIGGTSWRASGGHSGQMRASLVPQSERSRSSEQVAQDLRKVLSGIPGVTVRTRAGGGLFILRMGSGGLERLQIEIRGHDLETAEALANQVAERVKTVEGVTDVRISRESGSPEDMVLVDRQKAASLKLTVSQIAGLLQTALSGTAAGQFREGGQESRLLVKMQGAEKMDLRDLLDLTVTNSDGQPVVLRNVVDVVSGTGPVRIERKDQERIVEVSVNFADRDLGSIVRDIREALQSVPRPRGFEILFGGDYEAQQEAFGELALAFVLALVLVYMVMACLYESLRDPLVVMFSVPLAAVGVLGILFLTGTSFNIQSFIGCIMLGGIVVNNAILLVDHTNLLRRRDAMPLEEAIREAGRRRLRPILMTALTTVCGLIPMAIGLGEGGEAQAPMARAVVGGLTSSTLITLLVIPVVYSLFERGRRPA